MSSRRSVISQPRLHVKCGSRHSVISTCTREQVCNALLMDVSNVVEEGQYTLLSEPQDFDANRDHFLSHAIITLTHVARFGYQSCNGQVRQLIREGANLIQQLQSIIAGKEFDPNQIEATIENARKYRWEEADPIIQQIPEQFTEYEIEQMFN